VSYEVWGEPDDGPELPDGWLDEDGAQDLRDEIARLNAIIHTPHSDDFWKAVSIEAEFQRQTRAADDGDKTPSAWFWLVGYLAGKALHACVAGDIKKAEHHVITAAAALANWHRSMFGDNGMRPGIEAPSEEPKP